MTKKVLGVVLADRSGSMQTCRKSSEDAINGFFKERAASAKVPEYWALDQFDDTHEGVFCFTDVPSVPVYHLNPRGCTALMDSIAKVILKIDAKRERKGFKSAQPIVVIVTDGYENASKEHNKASIKKLIEAKTSDGWQFIYLGANQDAIQEGSSFGMSINTSISYDTAYLDFATASASSMMTRGLAGKGYSFNESERSGSMGGNNTTFNNTWNGNRSDWVS